MGLFSKLTKPLKNAFRGALAIGTGGMSELAYRYAIQKPQEQAKEKAKQATKQAVVNADAIQKEQATNENERRRNQLRDLYQLRQMGLLGQTQNYNTPFKTLLGA